MLSLLIEKVQASGRLIGRGVLLGALVLLSPARGVAQESSPQSLRPLVGLTAGINMNMHRAGFTGLPGIPSCCNGYDNGTGTGFFVGPTARFPIDAAWSLGLDLVYSDLSALLKKTEDIGPTLTARGVEEATVELSIQSKTQVLDFRPTIRYRLAGYLPLTLYAGPGIGLFLKNDFDQKELLLTPVDVPFKDGTRVRNVRAGTVPSAGTLFVSFNAGLTYEWNSGPSWTIAPQIGLQSGITSLSGGVTWVPNALYAGVGVLYRLPAPPPPPPLPPLPAIAAHLAFRAYTADRTPLDTPRILVENTLRSELFPMLPYVFFAQENASLAGSSQVAIPSERMGSFNSAALPGQTLVYYGNLLNIIGERMRRDPSAEITLTGCNNMQGAEKNNASLSRRRAEAVRDYLVSVWGIDPKRMKIRTRNLPKEAPDPTTLEGQEEARRVEISSESPLLLAPIQKQDVVQAVSYCGIDFLPDVTAEGGLRSWSLDVRQGTRTMFAKTGAKDIPPALTWTLDSATTPDPNQDVVAALTVTDMQGQMRGARAAFRVERESRTEQAYERQGDRRIDRFNLILFEFNKANLGVENSRIIDLVRSAVVPGATVTIKGYADRTGDPELNRRLARERCDAVQAALGALPANVELRIEAIGSDSLLYNNDIPEGRNFCRTVVIIIER